ncbi:LacI family transcriptional regulator [Sporolactobacillus sp. THM7-4]|nr:LacI family transcriptional regulator [Sporolactobacillus sp. THM7-4]
MKNLGKRIPEDYSIIGYDDIDWCQYVEPQLTTIHQPIYEMGARSTVMLLNRIQNPSIGQQKYKFNVSLVIQASTKILEQEE